MAERPHGMGEVRGSTPLESTIKLFGNEGFFVATVFKSCDPSIQILGKKVKYWILTKEQTGMPTSKKLPAIWTDDLAIDLFKVSADPIKHIKNSFS